VGAQVETVAFAGSFDASPSQRGLAVTMLKETNA